MQSQCMICCVVLHKLEFCHAEPLHNMLCDSAQTEVLPCRASAWYAVLHPEVLADHTKWWLDLYHLGDWGVGGRGRRGWGCTECKESGAAALYVYIYTYIYDSYMFWQGTGRDQSVMTCLEIRD